MAKTKKVKPVKPILNADTDALSPNTTPPGCPFDEPLPSPEPEENKSEKNQHKPGSYKILEVKYDGRRIHIEFEKQENSSELIPGTFVVVNLMNAAHDIMSQRYYVQIVSGKNATLIDLNNKLYYYLSPGMIMNEVEVEISDAPLPSQEPEEHKRILLHNTGIDGLLGVDKETLNELNKQIGDFENSTAGGALPYVEGSAVKLPEGTKPEIIYHMPKPPVYGVTNTMEDAINQQKEAGIPELKDYADPMSNKSTDELIHIIAGRQTDKVRQRKVLRLLREKLQ